MVMILDFNRFHCCLALKDYAPNLDCKSSFGAKYTREHIINFTVLKLVGIKKLGQLAY